MFTAIMLSYAVILCFLFAESFRWSDNSQWRIWFLRLMLFGMIYDNLAQGLGFLFVEQDWFVALNYPRYYLHVWVLPFLTLFTLAIMKDAGVGIASNRVFSVFCIAFTLIALAFGSWQELPGLELAVQDEAGLVKLKKVGASIPYATVLTNFLVIIMAAAVWKVSGWKWLFLGALFIFILNSATGGLSWGFAVGNFAEVVFIFSLLQTEKHFTQKRL